MICGRLNIRITRSLSVLFLAAALVALVGQSPGCGVAGSSNLLWFEATAGANARVLSQGPGRSLTLGCVADGVPCQWTVRMILRNTEAIRAWSLSLLGESGTALVRVTDFDYTLTAFNVAVGGEVSGNEPNLLVGTGASSNTAGGVPAGQYVLIEFQLVFDNPLSGPEVRTILAQFGDRAWADEDPDDEVPPLIQVGANLPAPVIEGAILPEPAIVIDLTAGEGDGDGGDDDDDELCADGADNDGDGREDCDDPDCDDHPLCRVRPTIQCPANLTVECDGAGNDAAVAAWLASATAQTTCQNLQVTNDFSGLDDPCGEAGTTVVTWRASDTCGTSTCSATLLIVDTTLPTITGPADLTFVCDESGTQTELRTWLASAVANDVCGDVAMAFARGATTFNCTGTIVWTATDECGNENTDSAALTIQGDTDPPRMTLNGSAALTLECGVDAYVELGAAVIDDCDATLVAATIGGAVVDTRTPGTYVVTYNAMDLCGRAAPQLTRTVTVVDTRPPRIELIDVELWPPNHEAVTLDLSDCARLIDDCEGEMDIDAVGKILSVESNESDDGEGDGNTTDDIVIVDDNTFRVRAERSGGGDGRVYSIRFEATDEEGHRLTDTCLVTVPHDQSGDHDDDDDDDDDDDEDDDGDDDD